MTGRDPFDALGLGLGGEALRQMVRRWVIDPAWVWNLGPSGIRWLGYRRPQSFRIESGRGGGSARLVATTWVVDGVSDIAGARQALEGFNRMAKGSTWWVDDSGEISLHCATPIVEASLEAATHDLSVVALAQLFTAEVMADAVADLVGGSPVVAEHPMSGRRPESDEILTMVEKALIPVGHSPSQFLRPEAIASARAVLEGSMWRGVEGEEGPVVTARWRGDTARAGRRAGGRERDLLSRMRVEIDPISQDPDLGSGLFTRVIAPCDGGAGGAGSGGARRGGAGSGGAAVDPAVAALALNRAERAGAFGGPTYGAWDVAEDDPGAVVHTWFTFNALYGPDRVRERATIACRRAEWAAHLLHRVAQES